MNLLSNALIEAGLTNFTKALSICINQNLPARSLRTHIFRLVLSLAGSGIYLSPERHVISSKLELNSDYRSVTVPVSLGVHQMFVTRK